MGKRMGSVIKKWVVLSLSSFIQRQMQRVGFVVALTG